MAGRACYRTDVACLRRREGGRRRRPTPIVQDQHRSEDATMLSELNQIVAPGPARTPAASVADTTLKAVAGTGVTATAAAQPLTHAAVEPGQALDRASRAALRAMFTDREVEISSFRDEGAGRVVYRVADRASGEVLLQSPPDALLRFFASARAALSEPLVSVEA
jgi:hypothetical protein